MMTRMEMEYGTVTMTEMTGERRVHQVRRAGYLLAARASQKRGDRALMVEVVEVAVQGTIRVE